MTNPLDFFTKETPVDPSLVPPPPPNMTAMPPGSPPALVLLDTLLGELAAVLPVGRGHYAAIGLQYLLEGVGVEAFNLVWARAQAKLAARGVTVAHNP